MRPAPKARHLPAALILLGVAAVYTYLAALDHRVSDAQASIAAVALKEHDPELFARDPVYGPSGLWRLHTPVFQAVLKLVLVPTGYRDPVLPFRVLVPIVTMLYLGGMYALLYRECRSWSVAVFVAVISSTVTYTLGEGYWGVGSLGSMTPATLYAALAPVIVLAMLRQERLAERQSRPSRLFVLFGLVGLGGNLDLVTAMNLTLVLVIVYLGRRRFALSAWPIALGCVLSALIGAMPYTLYYLVMRMTAAGGPHVDSEAIHRAFEIARVAVLFPDVLKPMLNWLAWMGLFAVVTAIVLSRLERLKVRDLGFWVWFVAACLFVATALQGLSQLVGRFTLGIPPVLDFVRASRLAMLPVYVLVAQGMTNLFRMMRRQQASLRWLAGGLAAAWMIPSDNLRVARHAAVEVGTVMLKPQDKPRSVRRHRRLRRRWTELAAIGEWGRRHTDKGAVFLTPQHELRVFGRRSIVASRHDARTIYYLAPWRLAELMRRLQRQDRVLDPPEGDRFDADSLAFVEELADRTEFQGAAWYVVLRSFVVVDDSDPLERIAPPDDAWGDQYALYRIKLPSRSTARLFDFPMR